MTPELGLQLALLAISGVTGVAAWSLKRNVSALDRALTQVATDVRQLSATLGMHGEKLAASAVALDSLEGRVKGIEDRERTRGCFGGCRFGERG